MAHSSVLCALPVHIFCLFFYFLLLYCLTFFFWLSRVYILYSEALHILWSFHINYLIYCHLKFSLMQLTASTFPFFLILFHFILFFFFWSQPAACRILIPWPKTESTYPALEAQSLNHWTLKEIPIFSFKVLLFLSWWRILPHCNIMAFSAFF